METKKPKNAKANITTLEPFPVPQVLEPIKEEMGESLKNLNSKLGEVLFSKIPPDELSENNLGLEWQNKIAQQEVYDIMDRLQIQPSQVIPEKNGKVIFKPDIPVISQITVMDQKKLKELPYHHMEIVALKLDLPIKNSHKLHKISSNIGYDTKDKLTITGGSWSHCVVIASVVLEYNTGVSNWIDARDKIATRLRLVDNYSRVLDLLETYITQN